ncbi:DUF5129 domain-containing protein [Corynebacterium hindlerae]|uniref:DUF5129 domain-containing protein n=1 Tax=Corynebacterium hindlerae TaxID=699041 RepID=UPI0031B72118
MSALSPAKIAGAALVAGLTLGTGAGLATFLSIDPPQRADYAISAPTQQGIANTQVHDPDNVLSDEDEARMLRDAERIEAPTTVQQLHYIVFARNKDNVNDSVENFLRDHHPDLIGDDHFADGTLFVGVGLNPRQAFVFAGEDVADLLDLRSGSHLDAALEAIKPGVKDDNIPAGLFAGADKATDTAELAEARYDNAVENRVGAGLGAGVGVGGVAAAVVGIGGAARRSREMKLAKARENLAFISKEYGSLGQRLDGIDIRANSLTSPLAHATMRAEWAEVRDRFLTMHSQVDSFGGLTASDDPKQILANADRINTAADTARQVSTAEQNIDTIFRIEHGDAAVRQVEATALRSDIVAAQAEVKNTKSGLYQSLSQARAAADTLVDQPAAPDFLERYTGLLKDYQAALAVLKSQQFSDAKEVEQLRAPKVYERDYHPGYGYADFVPFWAMQSWHNNNVAAQQSSSSSTNSSFSSGFSGAGGSSSF